MINANAFENPIAVEQSVIKDAYLRVAFAVELTVNVYLHESKKRRHRRRAAPLVQGIEAGRAGRSTWIERIQAWECVSSRFTENSARQFTWAATHPRHRDRRRNRRNRRGANRPTGRDP